MLVPHGGRQWCASLGKLACIKYKISSTFFTLITIPAAIAQRLECVCVIHMYNTDNFQGLCHEQNPCTVSATLTIDLTFNFNSIYTFIHSCLLSHY